MSAAGSAASAPTAFSGKNRSAAWMLVGSLATALLLVGLWKTLPMTDYMRIAVEWIDEGGPTSIVIFYLLYVVCSLIGIPRTLFNVSAGFLFSFPIAIAAVVTAAGTAHTLSFLIARTVARDWVERRIAKMPNVGCLLDMVNEEGFKVVFLVRMNPFIPGIVKGYGLGTTRIPFRTYITASVLGFLPIGLAHVYLGWVGGEAMLDETSGPTALQQWLLWGGVIASVALVAIMYFYGKRALGTRLGASK